MKKGFTLIELLVIIAIIGLLATLITPNVSKLLKETKKKQLYYSINSIVDSVGNVNIEGTEDCWYRSSNDDYKLPDGISDLEIFIFRKNNEYKYGVYAVDSNNTELINTGDFKSLNAKKSSTWIDDSNLIDSFLGIDTNDISKIADLNFCKVLKEKQE